MKTTQSIPTSRDLQAQQKAFYDQTKSRIIDQQSTLQHDPSIFGIKSKEISASASDHYELYITAAQLNYAKFNSDSFLPTHQRYARYKFANTSTK